MPSKLLDLLHLDIRSVLVTVVVLPVLMFAVKRVTGFVKEHLGQGLDALFYVAGRVFSRSLATRTSLRQYCRIHLEKASTKWLQVPGASSVALSTDDAFVPLKLNSPGADPDRILNSLEGLRFMHGQRVQVVGDPGSGKSSLTKYIFRSLCRNALSHSPNAHLPILVELKKLNPPSESLSDHDLGHWALTELRRIVNETEGFEMGRLFDSYASSNGLFLLLDGLDEVSSEDYPDVSRAVRSLSSVLENLSTRTNVILTMRSQFHSQIRSDFEETFPEIFHIQPFTPSDVYEFLSRWPFRENKKGAIRRIFAELTDRPTLREMCSNPLVLSMYVASDQGGDSDGSPDTRTAFYLQVVEELLVARRARQLGVLAKSVLREQREAILGRLAYENLTTPSAAANSLSWARGVQVALEVFGCLSSEEAEGRLRELATETGIISEERTGESFRFIHLTFCEFLAAKETAEGRSTRWWDLIHAHARNMASGTPQSRARLVEVIPFAVALLPRAQKAEALSDVHLYTDREVMARTFLETQGYDHSSWKYYSEGEIEALLAVDASRWDDDWLRRLHLLNVVLRDQENWANAYGKVGTRTLEAVFQGLVGDDRGKLSKVFASYASLDPAASFRLAASVGVDLVVEQPKLVVEGLTSRPFFAIAEDEFRRRPDQTAAWASIFASGAMRSPTVARRLSKLNPPRQLQRLARKVPADQCWHSESEPGKNGGALGQRWQSSVLALSLTLAVANLQRDEGSGEATADLNLIAELSPPRNLRRAGFFYAAGATLLVGICAIVVLSTHAGQVPKWVALFSFFGFACVYSVVTYPLNRRRIYLGLLNLNPIYLVKARHSWIQWRMSPGLVLARVLCRRQMRAGAALLRPGFVPPFVRLTFSSGEISELPSMLVSIRSLRLPDAGMSDVEIEWLEARPFARSGRWLRRFGPVDPRRDLGW